MNIDKLYGSDFQLGIADGSLSSARAVLPVVLDHIAPLSVVDLGCGPGAWLRAFADLGVTDVLGIDGPYVDVADLLVDEQEFRHHDLRDRVTLGRRFDLAMSVEVAEHLPIERAPTFVDDLCALADTVLFSAAIPGQGGVGHINEQWQSYWVSLFADRGFGVKDVLRSRLWTNQDVAHCYSQNLFLFVLGGAPVSDLPLDLVHPKAFEGFHGWLAQLSLGDTLAMLPAATKRYLSHHVPGRVHHIRRGLKPV
jgi:SAM-dependent methyltransferase